MPLLAVITRGEYRGAAAIGSIPRVEGARNPHNHPYPRVCGSVDDECGAARCRFMARRRKKKEKKGETSFPASPPNAYHGHYRDTNWHKVFPLRGDVFHRCILRTTILLHLNCKPRFSFPFPRELCRPFFIFAKWNAVRNISRSPSAPNIS